MNPWPLDMGASEHRRTLECVDDELGEAFAVAQSSTRRDRASMDEGEAPSPATLRCGMTTWTGDGPVRAGGAGDGRVQPQRESGAIQPVLPDHVSWSVSRPNARRRSVWYSIMSSCCQCIFGQSIGKLTPRTNRACRRAAGRTPRAGANSTPVPTDVS